MVLPTTSSTPAKDPASAFAGRVASIDAFRGLVMFLMMAEILKFARLAKVFPDNGLWSLLAHHQTHTA